MTLSWKYLVPAAFACFVFTLFWELAAGSAQGLERATGIVLTGFTVVVIAMFLRRVRMNVSAVHGDKVDLTNW